MCFNFAVHFWAPTFKWGLTIANILDSSKPPEELSYPQQSVLACSGLIWARYGTVITPKNWNLASVQFWDVSNCPVSTVTKNSA
ncbi:mitochondrial pyruvate carrier 3 isoform X2 [Prunus yedoensis var. nudiflora]|uniref:Mitochondrial pyruvate carrier n=1 Tax=Prunus yedoensis var. nudiflora TaxID=2094558 RepID=A0A314Z9X3_PRUYE|nr:mitochondrial pyruvate carrier 3 isoform X2 [Prunus yedoensis var. nudiflora]